MAEFTPEEIIERRVRYAPEVRGIDPFGQRGRYVAASMSVLIDLLVAAADPGMVDQAIQALQEDADQGDPEAQAQLRWLDDRKTGDQTTIRSATDAELVELQQSGRDLVSQLFLVATLSDATTSTRKFTILHDELQRLDADNNMLAAAMIILLDSAFLDAKAAIAGPGGATPDAEERDDLVPLVMNDDGTLTFVASQSLPFTPDFNWEEIAQLVKSLIHDSDDITGSKLMRRSANRYPEAWESEIQRAVDLKRKGQFLASARIYESLSRQSGMLYSGVVAGLYKPVAASGALLSGFFLLMNGLTIFQNDATAVANAAGMRSGFQDHLSRLTKSTGSKSELEAYLRDVCGNVNYRLPRDYQEAVGELRQHLEHHTARIAELNKAGQQRAAGGCYIATAVYGSYDAQPVLSLRRFRDETLAESFAGRTFIRIYYAVSPAIAERLKGATRLNRAVRGVLDFVVRRLDARE